VKTYSDCKTWTIHQGDCFEGLDLLEESSVDAIVCDPPYGLSDHDPVDVSKALTAWLSGQSYTHDRVGFMGKSWDSFVPGPEVWRKCFLALKPGGHLLAFAGTRTVDLMGIALRLAGFEIRDSVIWLHGQGFPKSLSVGKALDKMAGVEREVVQRVRVDGRTTGESVSGYHYDMDANVQAGPPVTPEAQQWEGWGTALKPSFEPILLARKPFKGTVAQNVLAHGTGGLNIDGCRVKISSNEPDSGAMFYKNRGLPMPENRQNYFGQGEDRVTKCAPIPGGRWPSNVVLQHLDGCTRSGVKKVKGSGSRPSHLGTGSGKTSEVFTQASAVVTTAYSDEDEDGNETVEKWDCIEGCPILNLDEMSGDLPAGVAGARNAANGYSGGWGAIEDKWGGYEDRGGASRFFYCAKASKNERTAGGRVPNRHPTVKALALMRYLCRLVTPPGGVVLDPFMGSGSTGVAAIQEGFKFIGIERDEDSARTARGRVKLALTPGLWEDPLEVKEEEPPAVPTSLDDLFGFDDE
jgi:site-specific DNA-methyltransferase (adenine-specific)